MDLMMATNNPHKAAEVGEIIKLFMPESQINILTASRFGKTINPEETGTTYRENAEIKAIAFYNELRIPTIADDSGLEIDYLDGAPGLYSSRFAGTEGNHKLNIEKVKLLLKGLDKKDRTARFRAVFCYFDGKEKFFTEGTVEGIITDEETGSGGFGYDPIFIPSGYSISFAAMPDNEKNRISHRANAVRQLLEELQKRNMI